ncbi:MAG: 7-cyano-7-deazaguanine synthase QueC [Candidatus Omnitrophica bacterium]|nr:7-cyano-7-deazaguanine synthase QueC [Candidatus Omnitrophota bacterium]MDD5352012.1 7-cyano-7-deazaguanine synthase QueC [Candidatus Omnitrophota bacterium]MDD5551066.1 7-cyano-7-deazaguanine synthase QueC [Candidatus Omnitrophota bacterium]
MKKAVVLLSGGLDSATTLFYARKKGYKVYCLIFDYNQRHKREIKSARRIAQEANCDYKVIKINLLWKGSALLDKNISIPKLATSGIPVTYVPARNTIFLSFALSYAETIGADQIFIGANAIDFSGYPDCRTPYYRVFNKLSKLATKVGVENKSIRINTPLIKKTKREIVLLAKKLKVPFELTWSCYKGGEKPCGVCDSCRLRAKGFTQAHTKDTLLG